MMPPKCYTWLESCGSQLWDGKNEKLFFCILQGVGFSRTLRTDIFLHTEKLSYADFTYLNTILPLSPNFHMLFSVNIFPLNISHASIPWNLCHLWEFWKKTTLQSKSFCFRLNRLYAWITYTPNKFPSWPFEAAAQYRFYTYIAVLVAWK